MTKPDATPSETLLLGLIYDQPLHGYDLNRLIEERGIRLWASIGFSSIYYLLEKLETRGLVVSSGSGSKAKKTFTITAAGKKTCKASTKHWIESRVANKNPLMNGLANSFVLTDKGLIKSFESRLAELESNLETLNKTWSSQKPVPQSAELLFSFSVSQIKSEISWIKKTLTRLGEKK